MNEKFLPEIESMFDQKFQGSWLYYIIFRTEGQNVKGLHMIWKAWIFCWISMAFEQLEE